MEKNQWIKCSERLPEKSGLYLALNKGSSSYFPFPIHFSKKYQMWNRTDCDILPPYDRFNITHWMPLPDAPEVEG